VAQLEELRRSFWRGRAVEVLAASSDRTLPPERSCPGCDWGFFELSAARNAKRALFLETMQRIGKIPAGSFGELPVTASPLAHRIRNRFHLSGRGGELVLGQFAPRTNRVEPISGCRAITGPTAEILLSVRDALAATGASVCELATLEDPGGGKRLARAVLQDGPKRLLKSDAEAVASALTPLFAGVKVVDFEGMLLREAGEPRLDIRAGGRTFLVSVDTFFQGNRHLADALLQDVGQASGSPPGDALDAFGGVGFFAAALLAAGHGVVSVEGSASAARDAAMTRLTWPDADRWKIVPSSVAGFLSGSHARFDLVVADPPRAGLAGIAKPLAGRARNRFVYVSCDPATLARDLADITAEGFEITGARLYDLFPLTHRVEAVVTLARVARKTA
jgi:23S rRNA (uracil1939-C5)-methyltransferase